MSVVMRGSLVILYSLVERYGKMKFSKENYHGVKTEMEIPDDCTLDEVLDRFQSFLRACGYVIEYNEVLDMVDMDT